jgi:hypothetical protein
MEHPTLHPWRWNPSKSVDPANFSVHQSMQVFSVVEHATLASATESAVAARRRSRAPIAKIRLLVMVNCLS